MKMVKQRRTEKDTQIEQQADDAHACRDTHTRKGCERVRRGGETRSSNSSVKEGTLRDERGRYQRGEEEMR